jgi:hypothetical protein
MSTKKSESKKLRKVQNRIPAEGNPPGRDSGLDQPLKEFVKASDPEPKSQVGVVDEAVSLAIGGEPVAPYDPEKHLHRGRGDVSGWPTAAVVMTAEGHQADADRAVAAVEAEHMQQRGARKGRQ